jgi:hypothetical protein
MVGSNHFQNKNDAAIDGVDVCPALIEPGIAAETKVLLYQHDEMMKTVFKQYL